MIFKFDKDIITTFLRYEKKIFSKVKAPLIFIIKTLDELGRSLTIKSLNKIDLNTIKEKKGKNYHWSVVKHKNISLVIRRYRHHLTIFTIVDKGKNRWDEPVVDIGAFTFHPNFELLKLSDGEHDKLMDSLYDKPFKIFNEYVKQLFEVLDERGVHWVTNSACLEVPDHIEIKLAFDKEELHSIDTFVFCMEEIGSVHLELFAETVMLKKLPELKSRIGEDFDHQYKIKSISTEVKDDYYHGVGILLVEKKDKNKTSFQDVYGLSRYYYENVFPKEKEHNGENED